MLPVTVLYEDADALVINKPAGLVVHSDGRTAEPTVVDWILKKYPKIKGVGDPPQPSTFNLQLTTNARPGIIHRLDRETSGALLIAKNQKAFWHFKKQFQKQLVRKEYHAFVYGAVKHDEGVIDRPIARSRANPVLWSATRGRKGQEREAVTEYRVLARFAPPPAVRIRQANGQVAVGGAERSEHFSFLALFPRTGRTHQIRVHLKAINYPVVCDKLYAPSRLSAAADRREGAPDEDCGLGFNRLALHSRAVSFFLPNGKRITVEAPYPEDFEQAISLIKHELKKTE